MTRSTTRTTLAFLVALLALPALARANLVDDLTSPTTSGECSGTSCSFHCAPFAQLYVSGYSYTDVFILDPPPNPTGRGHWVRQDGSVHASASCGGARVECGGVGGCGSGSGDIRTRYGDSGLCLVQGSGAVTSGRCFAYGGTGTFHSACGQLVGAEYDDAGGRPGDGGAYDTTFDACEYLITNDPPPPPAIRS